MLDKKDAIKKQKEHEKDFRKYVGVDLKRLPKAFPSWIDPQIRNVVVELNNQGFKTILSCAGHLQPGKTPRVVKMRVDNLQLGITEDIWLSEGYGYIILHKQGYNKERVYKILKMHGITGIKQHVGKIHNIPCVLITFDHMGPKPRMKGEIGSGITINSI